METVDFYPKKFHEIPRQDNPAFDNNECLMIVAESHANNGHAVVLHIDPNTIEAVNHIAKFWRHDRAVDYCETFTHPVDSTDPAGKAEE